MLISLLDLLVQKQTGAPGAPRGVSPLQALMGRPESFQPKRQSARTPASEAASAGISLSPEEEEKLRRRRLFTTGLGILAADPEADDLSRIAQGFLTGTELSRERREDLLERKIDLQELAIDLREEERSEIRRLNRRELFEGTDLSDPATRTRLMGELIKAGDFEAAQKLNSFESSIQDKEVIEGSGKITVLDTRTLETTEIEVPDLRGEGTTKVNQGSQIAIVDNATGEPITTVPVFPDPEKTSERIKARSDAINQITDDFRSQTGDLQQALSLGTSATEGPRGDPAAQQTLVIALNKLLDPGSVVRQSEFARVQELGGFKAGAQKFANRLVSEGELPPELEQTLRDEISRLTEIKRGELEDEIDFFIRRGQESGIQNPRLLIRDELLELRNQDDEDSEDMNILTEGLQ